MEKMRNNQTTLVFFAFKKVPFFSPRPLASLLKLASLPIDLPLCVEGQIARSGKLWCCLGSITTAEAPHFSFRPKKIWEFSRSRQQQRRQYWFFSFLTAVEYLLSFFREFEWSGGSDEKVLVMGGRIMRSEEGEDVETFVRKILEAQKNEWMREKWVLRAKVGWIAGYRCCRGNLSALDIHFKLWW